MAKSGAYAVPITVTAIGDFALQLCFDLTGVIISANVTSIGTYAFYGCTRLPTVTIPGGVISIGVNAFDSCYALKSAVFIGNAPGMESSVFASAAAGFSVYFFNDKSGFTTPAWKGYQAINMGASSKVAAWLVTNGFAYNADVNSDPNGSGMSLLMAYALALDPKQNLSLWVPKSVIVGNQLRLTFYAGNPDVTYKVESSTDLRIWSTDGVTLSVPDANKLRIASVPITGSSRYLHLAVTVP